MMEKDLLVTLNSDDPAYFGGYVNDNFRAVQRALDLSRAELVAVARNSFVASMMPEADKARALAEFDRAVAAIRGDSKPRQAASRNSCCAASTSARVGSEFSIPR